MRSALFILCLLLAGCSGKTDPRDETQDAKKDQSPPSLKFDRTNPQRTVRWLHELTVPFGRVEGNVLAFQEIKSHLQNELTQLAGQKIDWPVQIHGIGTDVLTLQSFEYPRTEKGLTAHYEEGDAGKPYFPGVKLQFMPSG